MKKNYVSTCYSFKSGDIKYYDVSYIPGITIMCAGRPWVKGEKNSSWVGFHCTDKLPKKTDKLAWEKHLGISLLPMI